MCSALQNFSLFSAGLSSKLGDDSLWWHALPVCPGDSTLLPLLVHVDNCAYVTFWPYRAKGFIEQTSAHAHIMQSKEVHISI